MQVKMSNVLIKFKDDSHEEFLNATEVIVEGSILMFVDVNYYIKGFNVDTVKHFDLMVIKSPIQSEGK